MSCKAQVLKDPVCVTVKPNTHCCCNNIITNVHPIELSMKKINVTILKGKVCCASDDNHPVEGAIVVATDDNNSFVGITNCHGEYSICVPLPEGCWGKYEVQAYYCCSCHGDFCEDAPCTCCSNDDDKE